MTRLTLRLPDDLHDRLRNASSQTGQSLNQTIVSALSAALDETSPDADQSPLREQLQQVRAALGDLIVEIDVSRFLAELGLADTHSGEETLRSLPSLDPPLSITVIEDREDRV